MLKKSASTKIYYFPSRKVVNGILINLEKINAGNFDEATIKLLLIDAREISIFFKSAAEASDIESEDKLISLGLENIAIDIANCVAHPTRDRKGLIFNLIQAHLNYLESTSLKNFKNDLKLNRPEILNANQITQTFIVTIQLLLELVGLNKNKIKPLIDSMFDRSSEISLCIMSLLQDTIFDLKTESLFANLFLAINNHAYVLKCSFIKSDLYPKPQEPFSEFILIESQIEATSNLEQSRFVVSRFGYMDVYDCYRNRENNFDLKPCSSLFYKYV